MITIKVNGVNFNFFENFSIDLRFDAIASSFSFDAVFDINNSLHRSLFKPLSYALTQIYYNGRLILTGYIINHTFPDSASPEKASFSGYSKTGLLEDCTIPESVYPIQFEEISLRNICEKLVAPFGLAVFVDSAVGQEVTKTIKVEAAKENDTVKKYLSSICNQKNIIITHDEKGNLVLTKAKANQQPVQFFNPSSNNTQMTLTTNGQSMYSESLVMRQASIDTENAGQSTVSNPFVPLFRSFTSIQSSGTDNDTNAAANNVLSKQLKNIKLSIKSDDITFDNGELIKPNNIITVQNSEIYLFDRTKFFIESVNLKGDKDKNIATLNCVIPEVYNKEVPKNIFE
mgnify:CR=1 FL=1